MIKVMKFGGSSVADAVNMNKAIDIVAQSFQKGGKIVVVVSALGGVTDELIQLADLAKVEDDKYKVLLKNIRERHNKIIKELIGKEAQSKVLKEISIKYSELEAEVTSIILAEKVSARSLDAVMSFGEQLSAYLMSEAIKSRGLQCEFVDARTIIKTDEAFGSANVDRENSYKLISDRLQGEGELFVMGGFMGSTSKGITTTLSRGGSDYTAALVGAALEAEAIEIWTDVDGLMTADPRKMKDALLIPEITYAEAEEMAYAGAKVIHPKTINPAVLKGIPIYIKNTFNPNGNGTKIN